MRRVVPLVGALCAAVAAVGVLVAVFRQLRVAALLEGTGPGYRLPELAVAAAAGAAVALCAAAVRRRTGPLLLIGPALLAALAWQATASEAVVVYDGSYIPLKGSTLSRAYASQTTVVFDGWAPADALVLLLGLVAGAGTVLALLRR